MNDRTATPGLAVVCFAVPDESQLFTAGLHKHRAGRYWRRFPFSAFGEVGARQVIVGHTGVGGSTATRDCLRRYFSVVAAHTCAVISAGYAGALRPDLAVGDLVLGANYSTPNLAEKAESCLADYRLRVGKLLTTPTAVESAAEKGTLHAATGALAVDMETAWIAEICASAGLPLLSLRVISDAADQDFPVLGRVLYDTVRQRPRYLALPAWLALHPGRIAPFARFVRGLGPARERLTQALRTVLTNL